MKSTNKAEDIWPDLEPASSDGRRHRSDRSRQKIIKAMFDLLHGGDMSPSAASIAEHAGVGLRTVFRHFEDMDSIYVEMTEQVFQAVQPKLNAPYEATLWRDLLLESVDRRADIYEMTFPIKVSMSLRRFQSEFLQKQYESDIELMRATLKSILPKELVSDKNLFAGLEVALGFSTWRRLRQEQNLSVNNAKRVITLILNGLVADVEI